MKVGVDARLLSRPLTGIGRYTLEMCLALCEIEGISLFLYSPSDIDESLVGRLSKATIKTGSWSNPILRQLWTESYLPLWAKKDGVDLFWGAAHRLPRWLPKRVARVVTIHDLVWKYAGDTMRPLSRQLERYQMPIAVKAADAIVTDSNATAEAINKEFSTNANKLSVVPLGVNLSKKLAPFESLEKQGINQPYFLFVGTLEPRKNLSRLLTAYSYLAAPLRERAMLVIAGGKGWGGVDIKDMVADLGLERHVHILGYIDESALATLYANALFLTMPSLYEGFGLPIVEAMAYGVPVLTSNNSSMPEVAGNAGLLIDPLDTQSIKNGLEKMIGNDELRKGLAMNARENATRFNWNTAADKLLSVFEKAIDGRRDKE